MLAMMALEGTEWFGGWTFQLLAMMLLDGTVSLSGWTFNIPTMMPLDGIQPPTLVSILEGSHCELVERNQ